MIKGQTFMKNILMTFTPIHRYVGRRRQEWVWMKNASYRRVSSADITHEKHIVMMTSFCRWQRVFRGVIFWVENCDVIFQQWQHINCVHIFKERWNIENDAVIFSEFSQTTTHFLSSLQTDKVAIYTDLFMSFLTSVQNKTVIYNKNYLLC